MAKLQTKHLPMPSSDLCVCSFAPDCLDLLHLPHHETFYDEDYVQLLQPNKGWKVFEMTHKNASEVFSQAPGL